jgi:pyruvate/2-oxoglutarate dehydrogenase complex dihydrolipoamide acyltransferase (E2) component
MPNLDLETSPKVSAFRKIAIGTWSGAYDPQTYGVFTLRVEQALQYIEEFRRKTGKRLTMTHLFGKAVAQALAAVPEVNSILRFNRPYLRKHVSVFFSVALRDPTTSQVELSGTRVIDVDKMSLADIVDAFESRVKGMRSGKDDSMKAAQATFGRIPFPLLNLALKALGFLSYQLNLDLRRFGVQNDVWGSVLITNIGSLGLEEAFVPLSPFSHLPVNLAVCPVKDSPVVENGEIKIRKTMRVNGTFDHRLFEGAQCVQFVKVVTDWMEQPYEHFGPIREAEVVGTQQAV